MPYGVYICLACAGVHRSLGVHISFVRSTTLDSWTEAQLATMAVGGNGPARTFFKQHGWNESGSDKIESKYTSSAAAKYRQTLAKQAAEYITSAGGSPKAAAIATAASLDPMKMLDDSDQLSPLGAPADGYAATASTAAPATNGNATAAPATAPASAASAPSQADAEAPKKPVTTSAVKSKINLGGRRTSSKTGAKKLGLVKKADAVDESLFSQV